MILTTNNSIFNINSINYNKNNNIFYINTFNFNKNNYIYNTNNYILKLKTQKPWVLTPDPRELSYDAGHNTRFCKS